MKTEKHSRYFPIFVTVLFLFVACFLFAGFAQEVHAASPGFVKKHGKTYYRLANGKYKKGWLTLNGKKYYFYKDTGVMRTGWAGKGKKRRFFSTKDGHMYTGWNSTEDGNLRYFRKKNGYMVTTSLTLDGKRYYFDEKTGHVRRGWVNTKKGTRFLHKKTGAMYVGLKRIGGYYYYYFNRTTGYMYKGGWGIIDGERYYFHPSTGRAQVGWMILDNYGYYFDDKGVLYVNKTAKINGQYYTFDENGRAGDVPYEMSGNNVRVYNSGRSYLLVKEYVTHPGIANGKVSDEELLAALIDCEASMQGEIGMTACALAILNRTICPDKDFPSKLRYVIYQGVNYPQYAPVRNGALLRRLNGNYEDKALAMKAAKKALKKFNNYVNHGTKRKLKGFSTKDFNYMYFMTPGSFWSQNLNFSKVQYCTYSAGGESHVFFVNWISG